MQAEGPLARYVPFDVSDEFLRAAATGILAEYADLQVHAVIGDFGRHLDRIPAGGRRLVAFLGGTIGNQTPAQRSRFFSDLNATMGARGPPPHRHRPREGPGAHRRRLRRRRAG